MIWPFRRRDDAGAEPEPDPGGPRSDPSAAAPGASPEPEDAPPDPLRSLGSRAFPTLLASFPDDGSTRLLDLGPAVGTNISRLAGRVASIEVADLPSGLAGLAPGEPGRRGLTDLLEQLLDRAPATGFDAVLAWDVPGRVAGHLGSDALSDLTTSLAHLTRPGGWLHLLVWSTPTMPATPLTPRLDRDGGLLARLDGPTRPAPKLPPARIRDLFGGFAVEHTYHLQNGLQESLMVRKGH